LKSIFWAWRQTEIPQGCLIYVLLLGFLHMCARPLESMSFQARGHRPAHVHPRSLHAAIARRSLVAPHSWPSSVPGDGSHRGGAGRRGRQGTLVRTIMEGRGQRRKRLMEEGHRRREGAPPEMSRARSSPLPALLRLGSSCVAQGRTPRLLALASLVALRRSRLMLVGGRKPVLLGDRTMLGAR
jgi:hypothetical protein